MMCNNKIFQALGLEHAKALLQGTRGRGTAAAAPENSGSLYEPGDGDDIEEGVVDKVYAMFSEYLLFVVQYAGLWIVL